MRVRVLSMCSTLTLVVLCILTVTLITLPLTTAHTTSHADDPFNIQQYMPTLNKKWVSACLKEGGGVSIESGQNNSCAAHGYYSDDQERVGWGYLHIVSNGDMSGDDQVYAAGYLEGWMTVTRIDESRQNLWQDAWNGTGPHKETIAFVHQMVDWNREMAARRGQYDLYWQQVGLIYRQLDGLYQGYHDNGGAYSWFDLLVLNMIGDWGDLDRTARPSAFQQADSQPIHPDDDHCSVLIKLLPNNADLMFGHGTWDSFSNMLRIFKLYQLPLSNVANPTTHFSSYPAVLDSYDDFYINVDTMLTVTETTNHVYNYSLYLANSIKTVPTWIRVIVANRLSNSGAEWKEYFSNFNSGTYNSQWMIVDHKLFTPGAPLVPNTLWVVSQMPGYFASGDMTHVLSEKGYWSSFNIPYFKELYVAMGFQALWEQYGDWEWSHDKSYRAAIFAREQANVVDMKGMQRTLTWNHYLTDPVSRKDAGHAIQARYDLSPVQKPSGGIDCKVTSSSWVKQKNGRVIAHSGPTHFSGDTPPFDWSKWPARAHRGMAAVYDFDFQEFYNDDAMGAQAPSQTEMESIVSLQ